MIQAFIDRFMAHPSDFIIAQAEHKLNDAIRSALENDTAPRAAAEGEA